MESPKKYIQVILPLRFRDTVTYSVPEELVPSLKVGSRVEVMLGYRKYKGFVEEITPSPRYDAGRVRDILAIDSEIYATPEDLKFWRTISDYYMCSSGEALKAATPFLMELLTQREKKMGTKTSISVPEPNEKGILGTNSAISVPEPDKKETLGTKAPISVPEPGERSSLSLISEIVDLHSEGKTTLLGTPCHKMMSPTEIKELYLHLAEEGLLKGKSTLILVPDIPSCRAMEKFFSQHSSHQTTTYHSGQTAAKRREATKSLLNGEPRIIIGLRSALFLPLRNLGLIIVDEEHSPLYKQSEPTPRYHARDAAIILAKILKANVLLSSATPSFESLHNVSIGKYAAISSPIAQGQYKPAELRIIDFSREFRTGSVKGPITHIALAALRESASKGIKTAIFRPKWVYPQAEEEWLPELKESLGEINTDIYTEFKDFESARTKPSLIVVLQGESLISTKSFRGEERALQQINGLQEIVQMGKHDGKVMVQTSLYKHNIFRYLSGKIPFGTLIQDRADINLPPFSRMIQITIKDSDRETLEQRGEEISRKLKELEVPEFDGPIPYSEESLMFQIRFPKDGRFQTIKRRIYSALYHYSHIIIDVDPL